MPAIVIENARVDYDVRKGGDRPVIFLHGGFGSSSELWTRTVTALPAPYTGYALNNFIRSDPPPTGYNVAAFAHRAGEFIKQLGLVRPVLVGHSMGGVVCQLAALEYPGLVGGLVLVCTGASMRNHELGRRLLAEMKSGRNAIETIRSVSSHWFHRPPPPGFFDEYVARASSASWQAIIDVQEFSDRGRCRRSSAGDHGAHADCLRRLRHGSYHRSRRDAAARHRGKPPCRHDRQRSFADARDTRCIRCRIPSFPCKRCLAGVRSRRPVRLDHDRKQAGTRASIDKGQTMSTPGTIQATPAALPVPRPAPSSAHSRKAIYAASIGNVMEWYDFNIFAFMAVPLAKNFFPGSDAAAGLLSTFAVLGVGLVVRPLGGLVIGRMGDVRGRKPALIFTVLLMAVGTGLIGVLPNYANIGILAPALLVAARMMQGFSTGGEWGSATTFMAEWSQNGRRGYFTSIQQLSNAVGLLLGSGIAALITTTLSADAIESWGWRIPFLIGALFGPIGLWLRRSIDETPPFRDTEDAGAQAAANSPEGKTWKAAATAVGFAAGWTVCFYAFLNFMPTFTRIQLKLSPAEFSLGEYDRCNCVHDFRTDYGSVVRPNWPQAAPASLKCGVLCSSAAGILAAAASPQFRPGGRRTASVWGCTLALFRARAGRHCRTFPDARAINVDVTLVLAGGCGVRRLYTVHLAVADSGDRIAPGADVLHHGSRGIELCRHPADARNCPRAVAMSCRKVMALAR